MAGVSAASSPTGMRVNPGRLSPRNTCELCRLQSAATPVRDQGPGGFWGGGRLKWKAGPALTSADKMAAADGEAAASAPQARLLTALWPRCCHAPPFCPCTRCGAVPQGPEAPWAPAWLVLHPQLSTCVLSCSAFSVRTSAAEPRLGCGDRGPLGPARFVCYCVSLLGRQ